MSAPTATMATGPLTASLFSPKWKKICPSPSVTPLVSLPNSFAARKTASAGFSALVRLMRALGPSVTPTRPLPSGATAGITSRGNVLPSRESVIRTLPVPSLSLMVSTTRRTDFCPPGSDTPSSSRMTSPSLMPASAATDLAATPGTSTPGWSICSASPTVLTCVSSVDIANTTLAMTPALMTSARSLAGRLRSRSGSSSGYGHSGSSSGNAT
mmetsp:Transcript_9621/g.39586  ORF Transcript_9621/g.39586 Transcript_9621/m.39586 type:complete len:213 (-) Transcript_9621:299-937(-)